ncbi:MAG: 50S ribosomal protein L11 methyltransferase [Nitrosomonadales bacterium]|nr:50S ribosomal protein L11 methyltransferase [Nitrosomonadales bacterium]|tara:strand:+ start:1475 stop:2362 length:888 start_codon:yes stop_codon:yes gene_type:complete
MSWTNLDVQTIKKDVDPISDYLIELGAISTSIQNTNLDKNNEELIFGEPNNQSQEYWKNTTVKALFEKTIDIELIKIALKNKFKKEDFFFETSVVQNQDWVKLTQSQFLPIHIDNRLWVIPTWHKIKDKKAINLILDPGLAFGTGTHPTTHLCLSWLIENVNKNKTILDYGCGSGILSIASKKLGAKNVIGVDIDDQALKASHENAKKNNVEIVWDNSQNIKNYKADIIISNILSSALTLLAPILSNYCNKNGKIALSGILKSQEKLIKKIYSEWFEMGPSKTREGWVIITGTKR